jgi:uncharacterized repeat protein (TIGR01451 family)
MRSIVGRAALLLAIFNGGLAFADQRGLPARYLVFTVDASGVVRPQFHALVTLSGERTLRSEEELHAWLGESPGPREHVAVRLLDRSGRIVFRDALSAARWLRSENGLHEAGEPEAPVFEPLLALAEKAFVVRVPWMAGSRLQMSLRSRRGMEADGAEPSRGTETHFEFDLDGLAEDQSLSLARYQPEARLLTAPAPTSGNRVDLLVMGDGYTAAQTAKFSSDSAALLASFFGISPYSAYSNYFNVTPLFTASNEAGADHPPYATGCPVTYPPTCCSDPLMLSDPLRGTFVDTAFDGAYCSTNTHRQVTVSVTKVLAAAAAAPDWDEILVLVNDSTYGGSGGVFSVVSTNANAVDVARHEFGHTFSQLTDEYTTAYPGFPACSDVAGTVPCEANATDQTSRAFLKWAPFVLPATPVPTPDTTAYSGVVGLFEGARYRPNGFYRPQRSCLMNTLGVPFCAVCVQEFVLRLYQGGFGVPAAGIDTIEPGSEDPAPGVVSLTFPASRTFGVSLLTPVGGPTLVSSWSVNGSVVPGANGASYTFTPPAPGRYSLRLTVRDVTPLVHPSRAGTTLTRTRSWTVDVSPLGDLSVRKSDNGSATNGLPLVYTIVATNGGPDQVLGAIVTDALPSPVAGATWTCNATGGSSCPGSGAGNLSAVVDLAAGGAATFMVTGTAAPGNLRQIVNTASVVPPSGFADFDPANNSASVTTPVARAMKFHTVSPCRLVDTRGAEGPALAGASARSFSVAGRCQVPSTAWAVSVNLTVTQPTGPGNLRAFPAGTPLPLASSLNYAAGQTRANNLILSLNEAGLASVFCGQASGTTHFLMDVNGYFE